MIDIAIIGAGTAGLSAAIYGVRAGRSVTVFEMNAPGGQIINTPEVENYPGIKNISGFEFAQGLYEQATGLGAEVKFEEVTGLKQDSEGWVVVTPKEEYPCRTVILAVGAKNRKLGLEHEDEWIGSGISYCATCDGAFYKGKDVAVAGGGNTALEDAAFLSNYCNKVYLIHRRNAFRGEQGLVDRLKEKENVEFVLNVTIEELLGENRLNGVRVKDKETGEEREIPVAGFFVAVGQVPSNGPFEGLIELDNGGYAKASEDGKTKCEGLFIAGDCRTKAVRQLTTAASDGANAAISATAFLEERYGR